MTTNNHPAHGPVSLDRLHQISEILSKAAAQSDGGNLGYAMADAVKVIDGAIAAFDAEPVAWRNKESGHCGTVLIQGKSPTECGYEPLYLAPPAPVVPEPKSYMDFWEQYPDMTAQEAIDRSAGWNACRAAMLQAGNSPATPDCWITVSERMPDDDDFVYIWPRPDFGIELHVGQYCECHPKGDGWYAQVYEQNYGIEWHPIIVTHWMPLPAAPQQEVK